MHSHIDGLHLWQSVFLPQVVQGVPFADARSFRIVEHKVVVLDILLRMVDCASEGNRHRAQNSITKPARMVVEVELSFILVGNDHFVEGSSMAKECAIPEVMAGHNIWSSRNKKLLSAI